MVGAGAGTSSGASGTTGIVLRGGDGGGAGGHDGRGGTWDPHLFMENKRHAVLLNGGGGDNLT